MRVTLFLVLPLPLPRPHRPPTPPLTVLCRISIDCLRFPLGRDGFFIYWYWYRLWPWSIVYLPVHLTDKGRDRWFIYRRPNWQSSDRVLCDEREDVVDDGRWGNRSKSSEVLHWSFLLTGVQYDNTHMVTTAETVHRFTAVFVLADSWVNETELPRNTN